MKSAEMHASKPKAGLGQIWCTKLVDGKSVPTKLEDTSEEFQAFCKRENERSRQQMEALAKAEKEDAIKQRRELVSMMNKFLDEFCFAEKREAADKALSEMITYITDDMSIFDIDDDA